MIRSGPVAGPGSMPRLIGRAPFVALAVGLVAPAYAEADEADDDFVARCADADVLRCVGFDQPADLGGNETANSGTLPGNALPEIDTGQRASGAGALRFTIPPNSGANSSGSFFTNFSEDLSAQIGGDDALFIQWRQRFSQEMVDTVYAGGGGWKQVIIGTGDQPGGENFFSCTALEVVVQNSSHRGFAQMYNSCTGSASHGPYDPFEEPFEGANFKLQNARPDPFCSYLQGQTDPPSYFPPEGNCIGYVADEWMTFQVGIETGPRVGDEFVDSRIRLWIARQGEESELVMDYGPYNLTAGPPDEAQAFGKVWLLPYNTGKDDSVAHPEAMTWYDELIVSRSPIADPGGDPVDDDEGGDDDVDTGSADEGTADEGPGDSGTQGADSTGGTTMVSVDDGDGPSGSASTSGGATDGAAADPDEDARGSGCGCTASPTETTGWWMFGALALLWARRRG